MKLHRFPRAVLRWIFRGVIAGLFLVIPTVLVGLDRYGFPPGLTAALAAGLGGENFRISIGRLRLNPLAGLVAEHVVVGSSEGKTLAKLNRVTLALGLSELLQRKIQVQALEMRRSKMAIPLPGGRDAILEIADARLLLMPGQLRLARCEFSFEGVDFSLQGTLANPQQLSFAPWRQPPHDADRDKQQRTQKEASDQGFDIATAESFARWVELLREFEFPSGAPLISAQFRGDAGDIAALEVDMLRGSATAVWWNNLRLRDFTFSGTWSDGRLVLDRLDLADQSGKLHAAGEVRPFERQAQLQVHSGLNPLPWVAALSPASWIEEVVLAAPPRLEASVAIDWEGSAPSYSVIGRVECADMAFRGVMVDLVQSDFAIRDGEFLTRGATVSAPWIDARLDAMLRGGTVKLRIEGKVDPTSCMPWLDAGMQRMVGEMEFAEPAWARMELQFPINDPGQLEGKGEAVLGRTAMRGAWIDSAKAAISIEDRAVAYDNLEISMEGGIGRGAFIYDFGRQQVRLPEIDSRLPPAEILRWIDPRIAEIAAQYRFREHPVVRGGGTVDMGDPTRTKLDLELDAGGGMDYDLLGQTLPVGATKAGIRVQGRSLNVEIREAALFAGKATVSAQVALQGRNPGYSLRAELDGVDFEKLTRLYFNYAESTGSMDGEIRYSAPLADQTLLGGTGWVRVKEGNVFAIPLLGPFSGILNSIVPGLGYQDARLATADFTIANRIIRTENLEIQGRGFSIFGVGDIHFTDDRLDMAVRLNAKGVPGLLLFPVSKLFEYVSTGSLSKPGWRPKNVPKELFGE